MKIERINVVEQIIDYLSSNIRQGAWKPGEQISSENQLVSELKVSRSSVRIAIQQLIAIGVLESFQGKGTFVKSVPVKDLKDRMRTISKNRALAQLMEFRMILEVGSCRLLGERISEEALDELDESLRGMENNRCNAQQFIDFDIKFHRLLMQATGNDILIQSMDLIRKEIEKQSWLLNNEATTKDAIRYHSLILDALRKRDGLKAAAYMNAHLHSVVEDEAEGA